MEEILASIRQIISEDLASVAAKPHGSEAGDDHDDVLVLRERAPLEPSPFAPLREEPAEDRAEAHPPEPEPPDARTAAPEAARPQSPEPQTSAAHAAEPDAVEPQSGAAGRGLTVAPSVELAVVAPETAAVVTASFERLAFVVENKPPPPPPVPVSPGGPTLEDITRDILTPVIMAWLDENLPAIVQARIDEEVERITRGRVR